MAKDSHCSSCGAPFGADPGWPRTCGNCGAVSYRNPLPVAVVLLPVRHTDGTGLVVIRRTIEPRLGRLALPGGFIDFGESWEQAVVRELSEETGIRASAADVTLADALTDEDGGYLLLFGLLPERDAAELPPSVPTDETDGHQILPRPAELGFPLHTLAARRWFDGAYDTPPHTR
ncbi:MULTISPECIES: NUDIX domain-containing protein [unclassified Streptomyces]|uniref:NUDIX domain-containing protein n=1 Tax=unclassified Streptomyces TaxID=2593676 RepID=UPI0036E813C9